MRLSGDRRGLKDLAKREAKRGSMMYNTLRVDNNNFNDLLNEEDASLEISSRASVSIEEKKVVVPNLRIKKIDIESIYPQHEKDKEGEKLKKLCDMHEGQKNLHADGTSLINQFVKPKRVLTVNKKVLASSHNMTPA